VKKAAVVAIQSAAREVGKSAPSGLDEERRPLGDRAQLAGDAARRENQGVVASVLEQLLGGPLLLGDALDLETEERRELVDEPGAFGVVGGEVDRVEEAAT